MARLRFTLPEPHDVRPLGRTVEPDEAVDVPDAVYASHEWPESAWEVVSAPRSVFDPADHTVAEVNAYLDGADDDERDRVLGLERDGKARAGVLGADE